MTEKSYIEIPEAGLSTLVADFSDDLQMKGALDGVVYLLSGTRSRRPCALVHSFPTSDGP